MRAYADDICATISADTPQKLIHMANGVFMRFCEWAGNYKLKFDENKTEALLFTRKHKVPDITLMFMNTRVEIKEKVRCLGVIVDRKLSWSEHVTTRVNAAKQYSLRLISAAKTTWGLKPLAVRNLYKGVIESTILYAMPVWVVAVKKKCIQNALRSVQRMSMIAISKGFRSAKTDTVTAVAGCLPLDQRAIEVSLSRYFKKGRPNYWPSQENWHSGISIKVEPRSIKHTADGKCDTNEYLRIPGKPQGKIAITYTYSYKFQIDSGDDAQQEFGWKLVHGDVFRPPRKGMLLSVFVGSGVQVFLMTLITLGPIDSNNVY
ncbi:hypothetical protein QYM36_015768 [Artemia franciscana]|uniref:Transmembrane 9 superfamily member n=1 Tax=Artemia franciscana TaxID=6661 RepID=A0AA88HHY6_ARTSF|nr:hypothetical protein QYM36_015768 [Artemia franciscana]